MNIKEAYPKSLGRPHFFSHLTRYAVICLGMAVSVSNFHSHTCYLDIFMAFKTDKEIRLMLGLPEILRGILLTGELPYSLSYENKNIFFQVFFFFLASIVKKLSFV